jgi:hypothetical protein
MASGGENLHLDAIDPTTLNNVYLDLPNENLFKKSLLRNRPTFGNTQASSSTCVNIDTKTSTIHESLFVESLKILHKHTKF